MPGAAHPTTIKIPGTSTAMVDQPCSLVSGTTYRITDAAKRVLDPDAAVTVKDGGVAVAAADYTVDPLFGTVTLDSAPGGAVTISASYLPLLTVGTARGFGIQASRTVLDDTTFGDLAKAKLLGLADGSVSLDLLEDLLEDHDPGAGARTLGDYLAQGLPVLVEIHPGAAGPYFRGWYVAESQEVAGEVDDLVTASLSLTCSARTITGRQDAASFGWGT